MSDRIPLSRLDRGGPWGEVLPLSRWSHPIVIAGVDLAPNGNILLDVAVPASHLTDPGSVCYTFRGSPERWARAGRIVIGPEAWQGMLAVLSTAVLSTTEPRS